MDKKVIPVDKKYTYLNQFMTELPTNCLFDKGRTGCAGTTIAIENEKNTIIAMPYVNLIKNKECQYPNEECDKELFGIYEGVTKKEIIDYVNSHEIKKIAVTYDSLDRLIDVLIDLEIDVYNDYFLLVDEYHVLFNSYCFRNEAIKRVLEYSRKFSEVTFMTATPIEKEFQLKELKDLRVVEVKWYNTIPVNITPEVTNDPQMRVCQLIRDRLEDKMFGNLHFFVNSVEFIAFIIKGLKLSPDDVKVVCSENKNQGRGKKSNQAKLGDYKIETPLDPVKKINFYTSMAFEGCDIYDQEGRIYIVSDKHKSHTLLDISTLIVQICGRIRNTQYMTDVHHIFSETRYSNHSTFEKYKEKTNQIMLEAKSFVDEINNVSDKNRKIILKAFLKSKNEGLNELYIKEQDNKFEFDENLINIDIVNFKITHQVYQSRVTLENEYQRNNFNLLASTEKNYKRIQITDKLKENSKSKISFTDLFEEYILLKEEQSNMFHFGNVDDRINLIEKERPLIKQSYDKLGIEKVREFKYNLTNIKREIHKKQIDISTDRKIINCLSDVGIKVGAFKTIEEINKKLQTIYNDLEIVDSNNKIKRAKATDLKKWFDVDKKSKKINKKTRDHYIINRIKIIFK